MEIIHLSNQKKNSLPKNEVYTIGNFDGVHKGHQNLIKLTKEVAKSLNSNWGVITFTPNTKSFFNSNYQFLNTTAQKLELFAKLKVSKIITIDFKQVYALTAAQFVKSYLIECLAIKALVVGSNFKMGKDLVIPSNNGTQQNSADKLASNNIINKGENYKVLGSTVYQHIYSNNNSFDLPIYSIKVDTNNGLNISSSNIKCLLEEGKIKEANKLLGYNFTAIAKVIHGNKLGRTLGFPTINMLIPEYVKLKYGIYATKALLPNGEIKNSVSNFGVRPTITNSDKKEILETFIFDFNEDLYNKIVAIEFVDFIREEKKFANLEELIAHIKKDVEKAKLILINPERNTANAN